MWVAAMPTGDDFPPLGCQQQVFTNEVCYSNADRKVFACYGEPILLCEDCYEKYIELAEPEPPELVI